LQDSFAVDNMKACMFMGWTACCHVQPAGAAAMARKSDAQANNSGLSKLATPKISTEKC
jgi:hypothetical protein